jgi:hypothetical protein
MLLFIKSIMGQFVRSGVNDFTTPLPESSRSKDWRLEIKFVLPSWAESSARLQLLNSDTGFRRSYSSRIVNNIYFDSIDHKAVQSNFSGIGERAKVRLRWYGDTRSPVNSVLEIKVKSRGAGTKLRHPISTQTRLGEMTWDEIRELISSGAEASIRRYFETSNHPMLFNTYSRQYYESYDQAVRATVDTEIRSRHQSDLLRPELTHISQPAGNLVVELKADVSNEQQLREAARSLTWRAGKHSKYIRGLYRQT